MDFWRVTTDTQLGLQKFMCRWPPEILPLNNFHSNSRLMTLWQREKAANFTNKKKIQYKFCSYENTKMQVKCVDFSICNIKTQSRSMGFLLFDVEYCFIEFTFMISRTRNFSMIEKLKHVVYSFYNHLLIL